MKSTTPKRYHPALVLLHWLTAFMIVFALFMGIFGLAPAPNNADKIPALMGHASFGLIVTLLFVIRFIVKLSTHAPAQAKTNNALLDRIGQQVHSLLYLLVIVMGLSGMATLVLSGAADVVFGGASIPLPDSFDMLLAHDIHYMTSRLLIALIALHACGALFHQLWLKDRLLHRMWFGSRH